MKIAIIGCGYIGKTLAKTWSEKGYIVTCTTRSHENLSELDQVCQKALIVDSSDENEIDLLIEHNDALVVTVAADSPENYHNAYLNTAKSIRKCALRAKSPKILLYTSSTGIYGDHKGHFVDESSDLLAKTQQAKILIETEKYYLSLKELGWKICIFRLSEIYGPDRSLQLRMEKLQNHVIPGNGENHTNMIHRDDIVGSMDYALSHHLEGIFNLSDDDHPKRKEFYDQLCIHLKLKPIIWDPHLHSIHGGNKRISNHKIKKAGYNLKHPHRVV